VGRNKFDRGIDEEQNVENGSAIVARNYATLESTVSLYGATVTSRIHKREVVAILSQTETQGATGLFGAVPGLNAPIYFLRSRLVRAPATGDLCEIQDDENRWQARSIGHVKTIAKTIYACELLDES